jgi:hypothetical protein
VKLTPGWQLATFFAVMTMKKKSVIKLKPGGTHRRKEVRSPGAAGQDGCGSFGSSPSSQRRLSLRHAHATRLQPPDSPILAISCLVCPVYFLFLPKLFLSLFFLNRCLVI